MNIGTAKPTAAELQRVPHHLVDIREVTEPMNAVTYASMAREAAEAIHRPRQQGVLVVGGSGFYLRSFFAPVGDEVPPSLRKCGAAGRPSAPGLGGARGGS